MLPFYRNQNPRDSISEAIWTWQSYPLHVFCWFQRNKDDITIVAQHLRDLFTTAAKRPSQRRDWNASAIWNHEFSNTNLEIFLWHTRQALMKWHIKVPKANSRWYVEYVQLVKTDVEFHCSRTLKIRRPLGRLIFNMGIATPGKTVFLIETAPRLLYSGRNFVEVSSDEFNWQ